MKINTPKELLKELKDRFPNLLPSDEKMTIEEIRIRQGEQKVINYLKELIEDDVSS